MFYTGTGFRGSRFDPGLSILTDEITDNSSYNSKVVGKRGLTPPSLIKLPLPLDKGKGINGVS